MATLKLTVVTPEKEIFSDEVSEVYVTTPEGEIGILPHHANLMARIIPGELRIKQNEKLQVLATGSGLLQVSQNNVSIMSDLAEKAEEINEKVVEEARQRAQAALEQKLSDEEYADTLAALEKSLAQLKVKRRFSKLRSYATPETSS